MKQWYEWVMILCDIIENMYKRPFTMPMQEGWIKMVKIKDVAEALMKQKTHDNPDDFCPSPIVPCTGRGFYRSDCPCPSCRAYMQGREDAKK